MTAKIDISLTLDEDGLYDIDIDDDGDIATDNSFDTPIYMSLGEERRADSSQVAPPERRRGWWGNLLNIVAGFEMGSLLWLLEQSRLTQAVKNNAEDFSRQSLEWMLDDGFLKSIEVTSEVVSNVGLRMRIDLVRFDNRSETRFYDAWDNTGSVI